MGREPIVSPYYNYQQPKNGSCWKSSTERRVVGERSWNGDVNYYSVEKDLWVRCQLHEWLDYQDTAKEVKNIKKWDIFNKKGFSADSHHKWLNLS